MPEDDFLAPLSQQKQQLQSKYIKKRERHRRERDRSEKRVDSETYNNSTLEHLRQSLFDLIGTNLGSIASVSVCSSHDDSLLNNNFII